MTPEQRWKAADPRDRQAALLSDRLSTVLAGKGAQVQGAALALALAKWLVGHRIEGDEDELQALWLRMLSHHVSEVYGAALAMDKEFGAKLDIKADGIRKGQG